MERAGKKERERKRLIAIALTKVYAAGTFLAESIINKRPPLLKASLVFSDSIQPIASPVNRRQVAPPHITGLGETTTK